MKYTQIVKSDGQIMPVKTIKRLKNYCGRTKSSGTFSCTTRSGSIHRWSLEPTLFELQGSSKGKRSTKGVGKKRRVEISTRAKLINVTYP